MFQKWLSDLAMISIKNKRAKKLNVLFSKVVCRSSKKKIFFVTTNINYIN